VLRTLRDKNRTGACGARPLAAVAGCCTGRRSLAARPSRAAGGRQFEGIRYHLPAIVTVIVTDAGVAKLAHDALDKNDRLLGGVGS
jgi:hypothetical protein